MRPGDLGLVIGTLDPGALDAITDVPGVRVGHVTLIEGEDIRTGVTAVVPGRSPLFAGASTLNGNGEVTGLHWVRESGLLTTPIGLTNTHSVGAVHEGMVRSAVAAGRVGWSLPVVGETWDGRLNDVDGFHVQPEHALSALAAASDGPVAEGNVGGGTGMICHGFKGGFGTASRMAGTYVVGAVVQANHGARARLMVDGVPVGREIGPDMVPLPPPVVTPGDQGSGSIVVVIATDAPLLPHQCDRLAVRALLGVARTGGAGENGSGDFAIAFATGNGNLEAAHVEIAMLANDAMNPLFYAAIEATEAAIVNALLAAETMSGIGGATAYALPHDLFVDVMHRYGRSSTAVRTDT